MAEHIHFWVPADRIPPGVDTWDPDAEPWRFASGVGHNVFELVVRLRSTGIDVSLGSRVPRGSRLVVLFGWLAFPKPYRAQATRVAIRAHGRIALIRSDTPLGWRLPLRPIVELMPTRASITEPWQQWVPPLPQRGLVPRRPSRMGTIRSVAFKGNPGSVPEELLSAGWGAELATRGVEWLLDVPTQVDGSDQTWHDFARVDVVLCVRRRSPESGSLARKPATRLINAWRAGAVPIAYREPGFRELGRDGVDVLFVDDPAGAVASIDALRRDPARISSLENAARVRAEEFDPGRVLGLWRETLLEAASQPSSLVRAMSR